MRIAAHAIDALVDGRSRNEAWLSSLYIVDPDVDSACDAQSLADERAPTPKVGKERSDPRPPEENSGDASTPLIWRPMYGQEESAPKPRQTYLDLNAAVEPGLT